MDKIKGCCRRCKSRKLKWYDGSLGYEAIVCRDCGTHHTNNKPTLDTNHKSYLKNGRQEIKELKKIRRLNN